MATLAGMDTIWNNEFNLKKKHYNVIKKNTNSKKERFRLSNS